MKDASAWNYNNWPDRVNYLSSWWYVDIAHCVWIWIWNFGYSSLCGAALINPNWPRESQFLSLWWKSCFHQRRKSILWLSNNGDKARASSSRDISGCFCVTNMNNTGVSCIFTIRALSWQLQICQTCFLLTWRIQNNLDKSKKISLKLLRFAHR